ncbi:hypothetical protein CARUB_v10024856mg [Capsella rubella]|uniref:Uncharacterized protein n=1 Tax=Capsella rubella TaxID=81985 RepID=R0HTB5_9BRAS|nr:F-box/kelch-repeat protein At2g29830 [Capsella rubella]EOA28635.1 hypothetical protein CARUB_v10024856mg [Capsella rubella]
MAVISALPGGSNGGDDPNKNPQEVEEIQDKENQNENLQEVVEENLPPPVPRVQLPGDIMEIIIARVPRCYQPNLSLVCKAFLQLITSPQHFSTRLLYGVTEPVLYALIGEPFNITPLSLFILYRSNRPLRFSRVPTPRPMYRGCSAVTIGHKIYLIGGFVGLYEPQRTAVVIDCRFHTFENLPNMERARCYAAAGVVDGKIYVIGGRLKRDDDWVEVYDVERRVWETVPSQSPDEATLDGTFGISVVMQGRILFRNLDCCLAYDPRQGLWQSWGHESQLMRFWNSTSCVVGDLLYTVDRTFSFENPVMVYYPNDLVWRPLMGVSAYELRMLNYEWSKMANFGGKLVILGRYYVRPRDICCVVIALETRQGGQIQGKVESVSHVYRDMRNSPSIHLCQTVTV